MKALKLMSFTFFALTASPVFAESLPAIEIIQRLVSGQSVDIDQHEKIGYTIKPLSRAEVIILQELSESQLPVASLRNVYSSLLSPGSIYTLGNCSKYILKWHNEGVYPLNVVNN